MGSKLMNRMQSCKQIRAAKVQNSATARFLGITEALPPNKNEEYSVALTAQAIAVNTGTLKKDSILVFVC